VGITKVPRLCVQRARSNAARACVPWLHNVGLVHDMWGFSLAAQAWPTALWWQHLGRGGSEFLPNSHPQVHTGALPGRSAAERCKRGHWLIWEQGRGDGQSRKLGLLLLVRDGSRCETRWGHQTTPAPVRVKTTRHPHPPPVAGLTFPHTRHPHG
jgi:hypothetical protein